MTSRSRWYLPVKFVAEWVFALLLLVLVAPVILIAAIAVKLTSSGPAFYTQTRVGRRGRHFRLIKLRTMVQNAEAGTGPVWSRAGDPRVTPLGRFLRASHIDEFPQLFNVLRGQMALIGPRPERPEIVAELECRLRNYGDRHNVRPGIGGLAQCNLPPDTSVESVRQKLVHDLYYVHAVNPLLDLKIALFTVGLLFAHVFKALWNVVAPPRESRVDEGIRMILLPEDLLIDTRSSVAREDAAARVPVAERRAAASHRTTHRTDESRDAATRDTDMDVSVTIPDGAIPVPARPK